MCGITDLNNASSRGCPARLWVAPQELEVYNCVGWCALDKLLENGRPLDLLHTGHVFHALQHLLFLNSVVPALLLCASDLGESIIQSNESTEDVLTSWFMIHTITSSRDKVRAYVEGLRKVSLIHKK